MKAEVHADARVGRGKVAVDVGFRSVKGTVNAPANARSVSRERQQSPYRHDCRRGISRLNVSRAAPRQYRSKDGNCDDKDDPSVNEFHSNQEQKDVTEYKRFLICKIKKQR